MKAPLFQEIENVLQEYGYSSVWYETRPEAPFPHLVVKLPPDERSRARTLTIKIDEEVLSLPLSLTNEDSHLESFVQMVSVLPFDIPLDSFWQVYRIVNFYNLPLTSPCFLLDETSRKVYCRFSFLKPGTAISGHTFLSLFGMILLYLDVFSGPIEEVANGLTVDEVLTKQMESVIKKAA